MPFLILSQVCIFNYTIKAYRESERIESVTKSPILNFIGESISGSSTIRAFRMSNLFNEKNYELLNKNILANQMVVAVWVW